MCKQLTKTEESVLRLFETGFDLCFAKDQIVSMLSEQHTQKAVSRALGGLVRKKKLVKEGSAFRLRKATPKMVSVSSRYTHPLGRSDYYQR